MAQQPQHQTESADSVHQKGDQFNEARREMAVCHRPELEPSTEPCHVHGGKPPSSALIRRVRGFPAVHMAGFCGRFEFGPVTHGHLSPCFVELISLLVNGIGALCLVLGLLRHKSKLPKPLQLEYLALGAAEEQTPEALAAERTDESYRALHSRAVDEMYHLEGQNLRRSAMFVCVSCFVLHCVGLAESFDKQHMFSAMRCSRGAAVLAWGLACVLLMTELRNGVNRSRLLLWFWIASAVLAWVQLYRGLLSLDWSGDDLGLTSTWIAVPVLCFSTAAVAVAAGHMLRHAQSQLAQLSTTVWMLLRCPDESRVKRLLKLAAKDATLVSCGLIGFAIHAMCKLWVSVLFGELINKIYQGDDVDQVLTEFAIATVAMGVFDAVGATSLDVAAVKLGTRLQRFTFNVMVEQDLAYFECRKTGKLMTVLSSNVSDVQSCLTFQLAGTFEGVLTSLVLVMYMFIKGPKLAAVFVACTLGPLAISSYEGHMTEKYTKRAKELEGDQGQVAQEHLSSMHTVKSFGVEEKSKRLYAAAVALTYQIQLKIALLEGCLQGLSETGFYAVIVVCLYYGSSSAEEDPSQRAFFVSFMIIANQAIENLQQTFEAVPEFARALGSVHKILEVLDNTCNMPYNGGNKLAHIQGRIELCELSFSYPSRPEKAVLSGFNLLIEAGTHVALVGASGCGKSSVISLVCRLWDPTAGTVLLDGVPVHTLDPQWLHQQLAVVLQEPTLFSGTVRDNITFGLQGPHDPTEAQIVQAAKHAFAHQFILGLPHGYDTVLGERGVSLSGGQKQRIAIARALIREPSVLLLDEATSALDTESELEVQQALQHVMQGRTMLVSAHRLSTIAQCHVVALVESGHVAEMGTLSQLMNSGGRYASLLSHCISPEDEHEDKHFQNTKMMLTELSNSGKDLAEIEGLVQRALEALKLDLQAKQDSQPEGSSSGTDSSDSESTS
eukprot:TRINITY_DN7250_c0_g2_i1.p1 TRINITY_DN7250_c0_g2~~TRINITY_DN7250_c0_g2_i1.p1  ORF type:complete len:951 (+),score=290.11 TRINITY_DN7250_c0_g2_i1:1213-4065(+)